MKTASITDGKWIKIKYSSSVKRNEKVPCVLIKKDLQNIRNGKEQGAQQRVQNAPGYSPFIPTRTYDPLSMLLCHAACPGSLAAGIASKGSLTVSLWVGLASRSHRQAGDWRQSPGCFFPCSSPPCYQICDSCCICP